MCEKKEWSWRLSELETCGGGEVILCCCGGGDGDRFVVVSTPSKAIEMVMIEKEKIKRIKSFREDSILTRE